MARITTFMYCENAQNIGNKIQITNPLQIIPVQFIPTNFSFTIVFGIIDFDCSIEHDLNIKFVYIDENGNECEVTNTAAKIPAEQATQRLPRKLQGFVACMEFKNISIMNKGTYATILTVDEHDLGKYEIEAIKVRK